jgi:hypothetical protein
MAEHEVIKHTKRAFKISRDPHKTWKEKAGEILVDVFIIVFAVSLSLYLHGRAEKKGERHIEEAFLLGLKTDLKNDLVELSNDSTMYEKVKSGFNYFLKAGWSEVSFSNDSAVKYRNILYNTTDLQPNDSRFQGLKASGKLYVIEDEELLNDILNLYQEKIPILLMQTHSFTHFKKERLSPYLDTHLFYDANNVSNMATVVKDGVFNNYMRNVGNINNILQYYHQVLDHSRMIISKIERKYP